MGHGHGDPYKIPDYRIYKVEKCPELMAVQRALAAKGLKDPWLRNEVWRYDPKYFSTHGKRFRSLFFAGFKYGFVAFVATIAIEKAFFSGNGHHGHDDHH